MLRTTSSALAASVAGMRPPKKSGITTPALSMLSIQSSVANWRCTTVSHPPSYEGSSVPGCPAGARPVRFLKSNDASPSKVTKMGFLLQVRAVARRKSRIAPGSVRPPEN